MAVEKPNYTQVPNVILDIFMSEMEGSELKVTLAIARQTFGYHRDRHNLSLSDLQKLTGLSRQGVVNAVDALMKCGLITRSDGKRGGFFYEINVEPTSQMNGLVNSVDQSTSQISRLEPVNSVDQSSQMNGLDLVKPVDLTTPTLKKEKETIKEKEEEEDHHHHPLLSESIGAAWSDTYGDDMPPKIKKAIVPLLAECGEAAVIHGITASASSSSRSFKYIAECARNYIPPAPAPASAPSYTLDVPGVYQLQPPAKAVATAPPPPLATSDPWQVILAELHHELMADAPAHKWLRGSALVQVGDVVGVPLYQVQVNDAAGVSWLSNRLAATIRKKLSVLLRQRVLVEIVCTEMEMAV